VTDAFAHAQTVDRRLTAPAGGCAFDLSFCPRIGPFFRTAPVSATLNSARSA
jgi:hypothetical protein